MSTRVKKIFPVIITLITASLFGIIVIQYLWLNNMVELRKEQVTHKIASNEASSTRNDDLHKPFLFVGSCQCLATY